MFDTDIRKMRNVLYSVHSQEPAKCNKSTVSSSNRFYGQNHTTSLIENERGINIKCIKCCLQESITLFCILLTLENVQSISNVYCNFGKFQRLLADFPSFWNKKPVGICGIT